MSRCVQSHTRDTGKHGGSKPPANNRLSPMLPSHVQRVISASVNSQAHRQHHPSTLNPLPSALVLECHRTGRRREQRLWASASISWRRPPTYKSLPRLSAHVHGPVRPRYRGEEPAHMISPQGVAHADRHRPNKLERNSVCLRPPYQAQAQDAILSRPSPCRAPAGWAWRRWAASARTASPRCRSRA